MFRPKHLGMISQLYHLFENVVEDLHSGDVDEDVVCGKVVEDVALG
jgi:hypothetical protein